jgi:anthranilate phosphoribosyltransferase
VRFAQDHGYRARAEALGLDSCRKENAGVTVARFLPSLDLMLRDLARDATVGELLPAQIGLAMGALLDPAVDEDSKALFLRDWARRGETAAELAACAETLLPRAVEPPLRGSWNGKPLLDCCGTGGGGLNLLNISTGIVFILAALGVPVVKHGNRGLTKKSGSADVLEVLGIRIDLPAEKMEACLEEVGAAFLFAPAYHTSFSVLAPVRKRLGAEGQRTVFNLLGPLLNPARPDTRLVSVFTPDNAQLYYGALLDFGTRDFVVACGEDAPQMKPLGELSANGKTIILGTRPEPDHDDRNSFTLTFQGNAMDRLETLLVDGAEDSARRLVAVLSNNEMGFARETLLLNAAAAAWAQGATPSIREGKTLADEALSSERALAVLRKWQSFSSRA